MNPMPDLLQLDAELQRLLDLSTAEREAHLAVLMHTDPARAALLARLLQLAGDAQTLDLAVDTHTGGVQVVARGAETPPDIPGYRIEALLGEGGMARVYAGWRVLGTVQQPVAIKLLRDAWPSASDQIRFLTEQQVLARLRHPHIATLLDVGLVGERPYMVLERIEGVPLDQHLIPGIAPIPAILAALDQIGDALQFAHAHFVVHRDLKPANVLVSPEGRIKLIDFGIAKQLQASGAQAEQTRDGRLPLTLRYAAPEQLAGGAVGVTSDIWQWGLMAYRLLSGRWPAERTDVTEDAWLTDRLRPDAQPLPPSAWITDGVRRRAVQGDLDAIVLQCLRHDPATRYRDMGAVRADLARHQVHQPVQARLPTRTYRLRRWLRRHRLMAVSAALSVVVVLVALAGALQLAARNAEHAARMDQVVDTVQQMLVGADPYTHAPGSVTVDAVVAAAGDRLLAAESATDPQFQLRLLELLAGLEERLQHPDRQRRLLERAAQLAETGGAGAAMHARTLQAGALLAQAKAGDLDGTLAGIAAFRDRYRLAEDQLPLDLLRAAAIVHVERGNTAQAQTLLSQIEHRLPAAEVLQRYDVLAERVTVLTRAERLDAALALLREAGTLLDPADPAHQPAWLRHRATVATLLGQQGRFDTGAPALQALAEETRQRLGADHPRVLELAANAGVFWLEAARPRRAWALLAAVDPAALEAAPLLSRAAVHITRSAAALYSGEPQAALADLLAGLHIGLELYGPESPRLAYVLERAAWTLFELEQPTLAAAFAAHAWRLSGQTRGAADQLLQLIALRQPVPGRPDPAFSGRQSGACAALEYAVLAARYGTTAMPASTTVPADCLAIAGMRLATLGLHWTPAPGIDPAPERMDTPLLRRWRGAYGPVLPLSSSERAALQAVLARLDPSAAAVLP